MRTSSNILWLGIKELRSLFRDTVMVVFIVWSFTGVIYVRANALGEAVNNASIAFVDEDRSALSRRLVAALYPPYFQTPTLIDASEIDRAMDASRYIFVVVIPPGFEADVRKGRRPALQLNIDATAVLQAGLGAGYIQSILLEEVARFAQRSDARTDATVTLVMRQAFNPNSSQSWFAAIVALLDQVSMLTIVLTGAALLREREHGTIEHLLVMPLTSFQIAMAKVLANGLVILIAFMASLQLVVAGVLAIPIAGSIWLLLAGTAIYLFAAAAIGIFLGTIARTMAQFALLMIMVLMPMMLLSGGVSPIESQPDVVQPFTWLLPSRHYMAFAQAVVFRGAGMEIVWPQLLTVAGLGSVFFVASLLIFRRSVIMSR